MERRAFFEGSTININVYRGVIEVETQVKRKDLPDYQTSVALDSQSSYPVAMPPRPAIASRAPCTGRSRGFTLVEIMTVVAAIAILAALAIPSLLKARNEAQAKACIANLRAIDAAKQIWASETKAAATVAPTAAALLPYFQRKVMPVCPAGGTYTIRKVNVLPTCSFSKNGHVM